MRDVEHVRCYHLGSDSQRFATIYDSTNRVSTIVSQEAEELTHPGRHDTLDCVNPSSFQRGIVGLLLVATTKDEPSPN
jgi:hypothetical protein